MKETIIRGNIAINEEDSISAPELSQTGLRICNMTRPREVNTGDEVLVEIYVCNSYDYPIDVRVDLLTYWNNSAITKYATAPARPLNGERSMIVIPFTFTMLDEPMAYCPCLFKKENDKWEIVQRTWPPHYGYWILSTTPVGHEPVVWDYFYTFEYPFVRKLGAEIKWNIFAEIGWTNMGNQECWQRMRAYLRWRDQWQGQTVKGTPWAVVGFFYPIGVDEMPEEDAIIDLYLEHSENCDDINGPYITTEQTTITIKPMFDPDTIHLKKLDTEESLVPGTKPNYLKLPAVVPPINKVHLFAKDSILDKPVSDILTVEGAVEGNIEIDIDPNTFFTKTMPNREWHLSLYGAADK